MPQVEFCTNRSKETCRINLVTDHRDAIALLSQAGCAMTDQVAVGLSGNHFRLAVRTLGEMQPTQRLADADERPEVECNLEDSRLGCQQVIVLTKGLNQDRRR